MEDAIIKDLNKEWPIELRAEKDTPLRELLIKQINELIQHDFEKLVFLLYRIDVDEARMRALLAQSKEADTAPLLADLIIERQLQKIKSRQDFTQRDNQISSEEKW
jgi:hypothetical protein